MWSAQAEIPIGQIVATGDLYRLAQRWFDGRLQMDWKPRAVESSQQLLEACGFTGSFWSLTG
jgi:hypothetical protein